METGTNRNVARLRVEIGGESQLVFVEPIASGPGYYRLSWNDRSYELEVVQLPSGALSVITPKAGNKSYELRCFETTSSEELLITIGGRQVRARVSDGRCRARTSTASPDGEHSVVAPMPGRVVRVPVEVGDVVEAGQPLAVVEAMKMENEVTAQAPGVVSDVRTTAGDSVDAGTVLVVVTAGERDG